MRSHLSSIFHRTNSGCRLNYWDLLSVHLWIFSLSFFTFYAFLFFLSFLNAIACILTCMLLCNRSHIQLYRLSYLKWYRNDMFALYLMMIAIYSFSFPIVILTILWLCDFTQLALLFFLETANVNGLGLSGAQLR